MYYLLTFNEDWADEHDVPALACFTEEEYNTWLEKPFLKKDPNYDPEETKKYKENLALWESFQSEFLLRGLGGKYVIDYSVEEKTWVENNKPPYMRKPEIEEYWSTVNAGLGNYGDCFEKQFRHLATGKDFVIAGKVKVSEVSEDFFTTFLKNKLYHLSLSNIFDDISENH